MLMLVQERDAASEEVAKAKKENQRKDTMIEALTQELAQAKEMQTRSAKELQQVSEQRDRLVEKVERLHAEKHQVEARYVCTCAHAIVHT